jgi:hypothetical protein
MTFFERAPAERADSVNQDDFAFSHRDAATNSRRQAVTHARKEIGHVTSQSNVSN